MFLVRRTVNGISINGYEYLLEPKKDIFDGESKLWKFKSKGQARRVLIQRGIDINTVEIVPEEECKNVNGY